MTITPLAQSKRIRRALLLATGQTTSYGSGAGVDDGGLEIGQLHRYTILTAGQYSGTVNITINSKTDTHSNECVFDDSTGLMWSRTTSAGVGPTSNGLLPWTTNANSEGIFTYLSAANAASLAGYTNWRVPNLFELVTLANYEVTNAAPDATAFPSWPVLYLWSSTTRPSPTSGALTVGFGSGDVAPVTKTTAGHGVALVRGPL